MRDEALPLGRRVRALQTLVSEHHRPFGYTATLEHLERVAGVRRHLWSGKPVWTSDALVVAVDELERSRASRLAFAEVFAARRRREKADGRRAPTAGDRAALGRGEWLRDPHDARVRHPSRRDRRRGEQGGGDVRPG